MNLKCWMKAAALVVLLSGCAHEPSRYQPLVAPVGTKASAATHNQQGIALFNQKQLKEAKQHFEQAVADDPTLAQAHYNLGLVFHRLGNTAEARKHFIEAADLAPGDKVIWDSPTLTSHGDVEKPSKPGEKPSPFGGGDGHGH